MRIPGPIALAAAATLLLAPAAARATDYCVAPNTACGGTNVPTLQAALDAADNAPNADRIFLGAATYTAPAAGGFVYNAPASPVEIVGAGALTTVTAPAGATNVLRLNGGASSTVHDLTVRLPQNVASGATGLVLFGPARQVGVTAHPTQANPHTGVQVHQGGSISDGGIALANALNVLGVQVAFGASGTAVSRTSIVARNGVSVQEPNVVLDRLRVTATAAGVAASRPGVVLRSSLLKPVAGGVGVLAFAQPGQPAAVTADGVTIVGDGSVGSIGAAASEIGFGTGATATVRNSIIRGVESSLARFADGGPASVVAQYSDYDPSATRASGSGGGAFSPPAGALEPGANVHVDPRFVNAASDFRLRPGSPVVDLGDPMTADGLAFDGAALITDGNGDGVARRDMGAYELPGQPVAPAPAPPSVSPAPPPVSATDRTAPAIGGLAVTNRVFRVDRRARVAAAKRGTRFRFSLSESAAVSFTLERRAARRRARYARVARFVRTLPAGRARVRFSGRVRVRGKVRSLRPGRYRATLRAVDRAGNRSAPRRVRFRVVRR